MSKTAEQWERFLDPDVVRPSLYMATMFITTFEILKDSFVDDIRNFYTDGFDGSGPRVGPEYKSKVLAKNKSPLYASLQWLRESGAINDEDLAMFEKLKDTRNLLAHQLFAIVTGQVESAHLAQFDTLVGLLRKIGVWWVVNVEIPTNPDFDGQEIDEEGIVPGSVLSLQMLIEVASGNTELLEQWRKGRVNERVNTYQHRAGCGQGLKTSCDLPVDLLQGPTSDRRTGRCSWAASVRKITAMMMAPCNCRCQRSKRTKAMPAAPREGLLLNTSR